MSSPILAHSFVSVPQKPALGEACNGCGLCCLVETCSLGRLLFLQKKGPCPALLWISDCSYYRCGLLYNPKQIFPKIPAWFIPLFKRLTHRQIAAQQGCDSDFILE
jgi:hypothetical protein